MDFQRHMRKNFLDNIVGFMKLRQEEIQIYNQFVYDGLCLLFLVYRKILLLTMQLMNFYQFIVNYQNHYNSQEMILLNRLRDPDTILNMLRIGNSNGPDYRICKRRPIRKISF